MHLSAARRSIALTGVLAAAAAAVAAAPAAARPAVPTANAVTISPFSGLSDGSIVYANAADLPGLDVADAEIAQSAAAVASSGSGLVGTDRLGVPLTTGNGTYGYGHGAGVNVGLLSSQTKPPTVNLTQVDATSPTKPVGTPNEVLHAPLDPLASADVLPGAATAAPTTTATTCPVTGTTVSSGTAHAANAKAVTAGAVSVATLAGTSDNVSTQKLVAAPAGQGLQSETVSTVAPLTLFAGTPAAITLKVLTPIALRTVATGAAGGASVFYGAVDDAGAPVSPTTDVLEIDAGGTSRTLTSQDVFTDHGIVLALGVADVTIFAPAHSLAGLDGTAVSTAANGTAASAAADLVRVTVPGVLPLPTSNPVGGTLGSVLNPVLNPVLSGLSPVLATLKTTLATAGLDVADVRVGHLESSAVVPAGGIRCTRAVTPTGPTGPTTNPLGESRKDVAATDVVPGQTFTYDIRVPNRGTSPITGVTVTDTPSAGLEFVSSTPAPSARSGGALTYALGTLQPNAFDVITLTFRVPAGTPAGTTFGNRATITGTYAGAPVTTTTTVDGPTAGTLPTGTSGVCTIAATMFASNRQVAPGERFAYLVNVQDVGGAPCTSVTVTDPIPGGTTFAGCQGTCTHTATTVTFPIGTLQPGQATTVGLIVADTATSGTITNTATATAAGANTVQLVSHLPAVTGASVVNDGTPVPGFGSGALDDATGELAFTGLGSAVPIVAGLLVLGGGGALALRRRRTAL